jgi:tetratricopeptide (TPR) repeat protein/transglutaminase-like putative cysteine protease
MRGFFRLFPFILGACVCAGIGLLALDLYAQAAGPGNSAKTSPAAAPSQTTAIPAGGKTPAAGPAKATDYSTEPYVIEKIATAVAFQNDGTNTMDVAVRTRIQSDAGIKQFGIVSLPYASASTSVQLAYARVTTPDGKTIATPAENVLDLPAQITQQVPFYSDIKVVQAAVKGLAVGDTLEYAFHATTTKPLDPGQFWYSDDFFKDGVALDEELEISVPQGRYVKVQSPDLQPTTTQKDGRAIYTWKTSHLESAGAADKNAAPAPKHPAVELTTFHNWDEVGAWFNALAAPQAVPDADVRAKALELTSGAKTEQEKIQALYNFVSMKYRYIGIDFGIGRYQPHAASDVMANDYGDCKDKHTLFTALLAAVGIKAYPALINTTAELDADVPSPAQFDHVITAIPQGQGYLFLDTTPEVAPYGYLIPDIRDKKALVIAGASDSALVETPADPPFQSFMNFTSDGSLTDSGEYDGKMQMTIRGDAELLFRIGLRAVGESQWNTALQTISSNLGFGGTVSGGTVSELEATDKPLEFDYSYKRERIGDWDNKQLSAPLPPVDLGAAPDESVKNPEPLKMGPPMNEDLIATIKLPADANPQVPAAVSLHEPFANYDATYSLSGGVLHIERKLAVTAHEVPVKQFDEYRKFVKQVVNDESRLIPVYSNQSATGGTSNPDAEALLKKGGAARISGDTDGAIADYQQAVAKDPNYLQAWLALGSSQMAIGDRKGGAKSMKKAAALAPGSYTTKVIARMLTIERLPDDSLEVWRMVQKQNPQDAEAAMAIGSLLMGKKEYSDALVELQTAAKLKPADASILVELGNAYIKTGDSDQGKASIQKAVALSSTAEVLNNAAWYLADANLNLDDALRYSTDAVKQVEAQTAKVTLDNATVGNFRFMNVLASDWDTLGWIQFKLGHNDDALGYLNAAWTLAENPMQAYHIGQVYEKLGRIHEAVIAYAEAVSGDGGEADAQKRLDALRPDGTFRAGQQAGVLTFQNERTIPLSYIYSGSANAIFNVLIGPGPKVIDVKFVSGSEALRERGAEALKKAKFNVEFPQGSSAVIARQGVLNCESVVPKCEFVLFPADSVRTVN